MTVITLSRARQIVATLDVAILGLATCWLAGRTFPNPTFMCALLPGLIMVCAGLALFGPATKFVDRDTEKALARAHENVRIYRSEARHAKAELELVKAELQTERERYPRKQSRLYVVTNSWADKFNLVANNAYIEDGFLWLEDGNGDDVALFDVKQVHGVVVTPAAAEGEAA